MEWHQCKLTSYASEPLLVNDLQLYDRTDAKCAFLEQRLNLVKGVLVILPYE